MMVGRVISKLSPVGTGPKIVLEDLCSHSLNRQTFDMNLIPYEIGVLISESRIPSQIALLLRCSSMV